MSTYLRRRERERRAFAHVLATVSVGETGALFDYLKERKNLSRAKWKSVLLAAIATGRPELVASVPQRAVAEGPDQTWWAQVRELAGNLDDPQMAALLLDVAQRERCRTLGVEPFPGSLSPLPW